MQLDDRPARRFEVLGNVARGLGALVALVGLVVGVPFALMEWGHWPITGMPTWEQVTDLPTTLVSDSTVLGIFTLALWAVWAVFTVSVLAEAIVQARGRREGLLPLPSPLQRLAGNLVGSVVIALGSFASLAAHAAPPVNAAGASQATAARPAGMGAVHALVVDEGSSDPSVRGASPAVPAANVLVENAAGEPPETPPASPVPATEGPAPAETGELVTVQRGDSPWALAETHLGDGMRWREIWEANRARPQPDGGVWSNPDDVIRPGWLLRLPGTGGAADVGNVAATPPVNLGPALPEETVTVEPGDHLWGMAEDQLVDAWDRAPSDAEVVPYWEQTIDANRERLMPPRDADDIYPGEQFLLPAAPADPLAPPPASDPTPGGGGPGGGTTPST
ncbi:MAG TPA: LysM peptidoglycan-binding domain-containing protein, partial [Acidimicrobiales bacterium]|nr:LysM peptidoglycan-binding domain-containing protein [Acidimicrobiales bacterium]